MNIFAPDEGRVEVLGEPMNERLKERLGYLPEERGLYKKMRMRELLRFFGEVKGRDRSFLDPRIETWAGRMGLGGWRKRRPQGPWKGKWHQVQLLMVVLRGPEIAGADDPLVGPDPVHDA